jgi:hypothetical protein
LEDELRKALVCLALLVPVLPSLADERFPGDVQRFIDRREGCDHMRGKIPEPGDTQRMREVEREIMKLCKGTDEELARLRKKYLRKPSVMRRLDEFESGILENGQGRFPRQHGYHAAIFIEFGN